MQISIGSSLNCFRFWALPPIPPCQRARLNLNAWRHLMRLRSYCCANGTCRWYLLALVLTQTERVTLRVYMAMLNSVVGKHMYGMKAALGVITSILSVVFRLIRHKHLVSGPSFGELMK